jgi:hypothetical protein
MTAVAAMAMARVGAGRSACTLVPRISVKGQRHPRASSPAHQHILDLIALRNSPGTIRAKCFLRRDKPII